MNRRRIGPSPDLCQLMWLLCIGTLLGCHREPEIHPLVGSWWFDLDGVRLATRIAGQDAGISSEIFGELAARSHESDQVLRIGTAAQLGQDPPFVVGPDTMHLTLGNQTIQATWTAHSPSSLTWVRDDAPAQDVRLQWLGHDHVRWVPSEGDTVRLARARP